MVIQIRYDGKRALLPVRVTPKGSGNELLPWVAGDCILKVKVTAPPESGKANEATIRLLASLLSVPKSHLSVTSGQQARQKQVAIALDHSLDASDLLRRLAVVFAIDPEGHIGLKPL